MWFGGGGAFRASTSTGSGGGLIAAASVFVRHFCRKRAENLRKINPKVSFPEANSIARDLYDVVKLHGPLTISNAWIQAKDSGVSGLNSKTHMKIMLKWMRGRQMLKLFPTLAGSSKKFLLCTLPEDPQVTEFRTAAALKLIKKPSMKRKKHKK